VNPVGTTSTSSDSPMKLKTLEKLASQLYCARQTAKRFEAMADEITKELKPLLVPSEKVLTGAFAVELVPVQEHLVPGYTVRASEKVIVTVQVAPEVGRVTPCAPSEVGRVTPCAPSSTPPPSFASVKT
jgi:hypothetical protein